MTFIVFKQFKQYERIACRVNLWVMLFTCCWMSYMMRVNMSLNIVAMVPQHRSSEATEFNKLTKEITTQLTTELTTEVTPELTSEVSTVTTEKPSVRFKRRVSVNETDSLNATVSDVVEPLSFFPDRDETYDWSANQQSMVLGSYYWSYVITSLIGGIVAERWSPCKLVFITTLISSLATIICPVAAKISLEFLVFLRVIVGACGGFVYPACHAMIARWIPRQEKGKFTAALMGGILGTVMTWSVSAPLMGVIGWPMAGFYLQGLAALIWSFVWYYLVADSPQEHKRISEGEKSYIQEALRETVSSEKGFPPLLAIFTSIPVLAMIILHFGNIWGLFFVMTAGPRYVSSVLNFNLSAAGAVAALPYLARLIMAFVFGSIGDMITQRHLMTTVTIRKTFCLFSHILPGVFLILLVTISNSTVMSVAFITISMGFNGAATLTNLQNHQDLSPNYAGTLYGIANAVGSCSGFITPAITASFTQTGNTAENWAPVFYVGASVYIATAVVFIVIGKAVIQPWNSKEESK